MGRDDQAIPRPEAAAIPDSLAHPQVSLTGGLDDERARALIDQLHEAEKGEGDIVVEVMTLGGDAELARRIVLEVDLVRRRSGRRILFLGKTVVYSAGTTIMSAFPRSDRYLTDDAVVMIHCRQLDKTVEISGPLRGSLPQVEALRLQIENGLAIEEENFRRLIAGSDISLDEVFEKALHNWYLPAEEALKRGLVAGVV